MLNNVLQWVAACLLDMILNDKRYTSRLFKSLLRHGWYHAFEAVLLRRNAGKVEIFLAKRGPEETFPGQWHVPGTLLYQEDTGDGAQADRLGQKEFCCRIKSYRRVGEYFNPDEGRGKCVHMVYLVELDGEPHGKGVWWPIDALPDDVIHFHREHIIPIALKAFVDQEE